MESNMDAQIPTQGSSITEHLLRFRLDWHVASLGKAMYGIIRQRRSVELLHGVYLAASTRPGKLQSSNEERLRAALRNLEPELAYSTAILSRDELIEVFGEEYAVAALPLNFEGCRTQSIARVGSRLILGEYGQDSARLAVVTRETCESFAPYERHSGVRHIHLVCPTGAADEVFVTTGDGTKLLDRLSVASGAPRLLARHRRWLAGYTGAASVRETYFFGTDFSNRPNYIETLEGARYFLPSSAYTKWIRSLTVLEERYLIVVSTELGRSEDHSVSVFDAEERSFILCTSWMDIFGGSARSPAARTSPERLRDRTVANGMGSMGRA